MDRADLLKEIGVRLRRAHGARLEGILLYGSEARGDSGPDSDIDVLVLLRGPVDCWQDLRTSIDAVYPLVLEIGRSIHPSPIDVADFRAQEFPLYRNARAEGVPV